MMQIWPSPLTHARHTRPPPFRKACRMSELPPLLTPQEAAASLHISTKTLRRMRASGLPFITLTSGSIRYNAHDIADYLARKTQRIEPKCPIDQKIRATGTTTSRSGVVDFMALAIPKTSKKPRR
ncbi:helix-turn-helix domain-containing protein [Thioclava sp.]|uniref:helix-turn-helix domain-containing protein n=1 Tax=Thioclava sp. TaxID=1933450 RepID=UPI003AA93A2E